MRSRLFYHLVWTTDHRTPLIDVEGARFLCRVLRPMAHENRAEVLEMGMVSTHIHLLIRAQPKTDLPTMVGRMKGATSRIAKRDSIAPLSWADGQSWRRNEDPALPARPAIPSSDRSDPGLGR